MIKFKKISFDQFKKDVLKLYPAMEESDIKEAYNEIELPKRGTKGSAGYDIRSPFGFTIEVDGQAKVIPTGIRAEMPENTYLQIVPRSGVGFKYGVSLANTVAIIDSDYFYSDNEGHVMLKFVPGFNNWEVVSGDRIAQGIFLQYFTTDDDDVIMVRKGGFGSTGK